MSENMESVKRYFNEFIEIITPSITYTMHQLYTTYHQWNNYFFPPDYGMVIEMDYSKIDEIVVEGKPVEWATKFLNGPPIHPLTGVIATSYDAIEIRYSNMYDRFRYIVQENEHIEHLCTDIIWCVADRREKSLVLFANYKLTDGTLVDITTELNEYTYSNDQELTIDSFEWNKIFHNGNRLSNHEVFFMDWQGKEHKQEPQQ